MKNNLFSVLTAGLVVLVLLALVVFVIVWPLINNYG